MLSCAHLNEFNSVRQSRTTFICSANPPKSIPAHDLIRAKTGCIRFNQSSELLATPSDIDTSKLEKLIHPHNVNVLYTEIQTLSISQFCIILHFNTHEALQAAIADPKNNIHRSPLPIYKGGWKPNERKECMLIINAPTTNDTTNLGEKLKTHIENLTGVHVNHINFPKASPQSMLTSQIVSQPRSASQPAIIEINQVVTPEILTSINNAPFEGLTLLVGGTSNPKLHRCTKCGNLGHLHTNCNLQYNTHITIHTNTTMFPYQEQKIKKITNAQSIIFGIPESPIINCPSKTVTLTYSSPNHLQQTINEKKSNFLYQFQPQQIYEWKLNGLCKTCKHPITLQNHKCKNPSHFKPTKPRVTITRPAEKQEMHRNNNRCEIIYKRSPRGTDAQTMMNQKIVVMHAKSAIPISIIPPSATASLAASATASSAVSATAKPLDLPSPIFPPHTQDVPSMPSKTTPQESTTQPPTLFPPYINVPPPPVRSKVNQAPNVNYGIMEKTHTSRFLKPKKPPARLERKKFSTPINITKGCSKSIPTNQIPDLIPLTPSDTLSIPKLPRYNTPKVTAKSVSIHDTNEIHMPSRTPQTPKITFPIPTHLKCMNKCLTNDTLENLKSLAENPMTPFVNHGKHHKMVFYGKTDSESKFVKYGWGKHNLESNNWPNVLSNVLQEVGKSIELPEYNSCLHNFFEDGCDSTPMHHDRTKRGKPDDVLMVCIGATRPFIFEENFSEITIPVVWFGQEFPVL